jgi:predicted CoA-binding protein
VLYLWGLYPRGVYWDRGKGGVELAEQQRLITDFVNRHVWAVVGASQDRSKFGNRVFRSLRDAGYTVYAVNPKGGELEGTKVYPSLADLPQLPEVIDLVVPPSVTEQVVKEAHRLGLTRIWMQPGAESEAAITYCHEQGIQVVDGACAMVWKRRWT